MIQKPPQDDTRKSRRQFIATSGATVGTAAAAGAVVPFTALARGVDPLIAVWAKLQARWSERDATYSKSADLFDALPENIRKGPRVTVKGPSGKVHLIRNGQDIHHAADYERAVDPRSLLQN